MNRPTSQCEVVVIVVAALHLNPSLLIVYGMVVTECFLFRVLGHYTGHPLLGAKVVAAMLMFATVSGILMALFLNTAGGAWDNAKKFIETGALGGKGSDSHKAAITGDTFDVNLIALRRSRDLCVTYLSPKTVVLALFVFKWL
ncbi:hypothetical protein Gotur_028294 [Gossypium turneri]